MWNKNFNMNKSVHNITLVFLSPGPSFLVSRGKHCFCLQGCFLTWSVHREACVRVRLFKT